MTRRIRKDGILEITHPPGAKLDYGIDWTAFLYSGETIVDSQWEVDSIDIELTDSTVDVATATIYAAGGSSNKSYTLTNTITTDHIPERINIRNIVLVCQDQ